MASKNIGALWLKEMKDGSQFMTGVIETLNGDVNIVVFANNRKEKPNQPDYQILRSEPRQPNAAGQNNPPDTRTDAQMGADPTIHDIPF